MFNLKELTFSFKSSDWRDTFVGIKKNKQTEKFEFQLPKGFKDFPVNEYASVKDLFFKTYRTYRKFFDEKRKLSEDNQFDGFSETEKGYSIEGKDGQTISYSKLNMLDSILDSYNELLILNVKNKLSKTNEVDYSKIHKYLHKAIFIDEETVFIDEMEFLKKIIDADSPTLIQMFCFVYSEIKKVLEEEFESNRVKSLSAEFREKYLTHDSSIFDEETFEETIAVLKDILDEIDRITPYKDADYWHFYDAIYKFLYGENEEPSDDDGNVWGMSNFSVLWEELCFAEAREWLTESQLLFADRVGIVKTFNNFQSPFYLQLNTYKEKRRNLRPDLVYINFRGNVESEHFERIYSIKTWEYNGMNLKLRQKYPNHDFYHLDELYLEYLNKNPKYRTDPYDDNNKFILAADHAEFMNKVNSYFSQFKDVSELMKMRPCIFNFTVIDYKYIAEETCIAKFLSEERRLDIKKQLVYEFALQLNYVGAGTNSEFWIPSFFDDIETDFEVVENTHREFVDSKIVVYKRNFLKLQSSYIQGDD